MKIPSLILGTFQYHSVSELLPIIKVAYSTGIIGYDTSPSYQTENMLGQALQELYKCNCIKRENVFIQDKIDGWQMESTKGNVAPFVDESLNKLKTDYIDVLFIHWPFPEYLFQTWESFQELKKAGKIKRIGLSNVRVRHLQKIISSTLIVPDVIQIERHPLRTCYDEINFCRKYNIQVEAYSPICRMDSRLNDSHILQELSKKYKKDIGQIILRWHQDTSVIPVFMSKNSKRIKDNTDIYDFSLTQKEIEMVNSLNENYKIFVESACCPGI